MGIQETLELEFEVTDLGLVAVSIASLTDDEIRKEFEDRKLAADFYALSDFQIKAKCKIRGIVTVDYDEAWHIEQANIALNAIRRGDLEDAARVLECASVVSSAAI